MEVGINTSKTWFVYIILASDSKLYTGVTTNILRRWKEHSTGRRGAKFFRGRYPVKLMYLEEVSNRTIAQQREYAIKQLSSKQKYYLIETVIHAGIVA